MNTYLTSCMIEKRKLTGAIQRIRSTLQEPRFWRPHTYRVIPYHFVRKIDDKISAAEELIKKADAFKLSHDQAAAAMYHASLELEVFRYLVAEEILISHE